MDGSYIREFASTQHSLYHFVKWQTEKQQHPNQFFFYLMLELTSAAC